MNCKKVKELLLTDYIDCEISIALRQKIDKHISGCNDCRSFQEQVEKNLPPLFSKARVDSPSDEMWHNIKSKILSKGQEAKDNIFILRPFVKKSIFAFATAAALLLAVISFKVQNGRHSVNNILLEEAYYLYNSGGNGKTGFFSQPNFGTIIEEYFM
jgi:anti-sigma-K factor RskA